MVDERVKFGHGIDAVATEAVDCLPGLARGQAQAVLLDGIGISATEALILARGRGGW